MSRTSTLAATPMAEALLIAADSSPVEESM
jgi:hypothetical protein